MCACVGGGGGGVFVLNASFNETIRAKKTKKKDERRKIDLCIGVQFFLIFFTDPLLH